MRPVRLQLKGFTSFKEETIVSFAHLDRFAVCGPTGAGKSSLFDAMTFALFADAPRVDTGKNADLVSLGRKSFSVSLDFLVAGRTYRAQRHRSRAGNDQPDQLSELGQIEPVAVGAKAVTAAVEKLLGLSYGHFTQSVFLPQGKFAELLRSAPSTRRKLLNELLRLLVYDRMREAAGQQEKSTGARREETERRLREDFGNVSPQARDELSLKLSAQQQTSEDAARQLPELRLKWEEARLHHDWTTELDARQQERNTLLARQPDIDLAQQELEAANRAAEVMPLLEQADSARKALAARQTSLTEANAVRLQRQAEHDSARAAKERAAWNAMQLPELRERLDRLTLAVGKLSLFDKLAVEIRQHQARHDALVKQRSKCGESMHTLTMTISSLESALSETESALSSIGYDQERHRRLEAVRDDAFRLRSQRDQLIGAVRQAEQDEARAEQAELAAAQAATNEAGARQACQQAQQQFDEAEQRLRAAEDAHRAVHLRASLKPGAPCPVCLQEVGKLPNNEPAPELEGRLSEFNQARTLLDAADASVAEATVSLKTTQAAAAAARRQAQESRSEATRLQQQTDRQQRMLLDKVGDLFNRLRVSATCDKPPQGGAPTAMPAFLAWSGDDDGAVPKGRRKTAAASSGRRKKTAVGLPPEPASPMGGAAATATEEIARIDESILAALEKSALQAEQHRQTEQDVLELRNALALRRKELEPLQAEQGRLDLDVDKTRQKLGEDHKALARTQAEIQKAAGTNDPVSESTRVRAEIDRLQHAQAEADQAEAQADKNLQIAEAACAGCQAELTGASSAAEAAERQTAEALAQANFADAAAADRAYREPQQLHALQSQIAEHAARLENLSARIAELEKSLHGRRVSRDECRQCEQAHSDCLQSRQQAQTEAALLQRQLDTMGQQLERAQQLRHELARQEQLQSVFEQLARDLRSDNFQAFLLEETLAGLVRDASGQLLRLTGDRYGLHFEEERIFVVDNDNAAEQRGIETLSGGETFLASLALALALSEQVQKIAGAVNLDCLFIDEGFGALDPETLRTVSDTIRALQVGGRMVGVITHVPELKEEFDQRLLVDRQGGSSRVRVEIC